MKQKPCKFCNVDNYEHRVLLNSETAEYSGLTISILSNGPTFGATLRVRSLTKDRLLVDSQDAIRINFCPVCGRKLTLGKGVFNYE